MSTHCTSMSPCSRARPRMLLFSTLSNISGKMVRMVIFMPGHPLSLS